MLLLWLLPILSARSQETNIFAMLSPNLRQFLDNHTGAAQILNQVIREAFPKKSVLVYYFYSTGEPNAYHWYSENSVIAIAVREEQQPLDEFLCLTYETLNTENEDSYLEIFKRVKLGTITKEEFVREILKNEYNCTRRLQVLIGDLKLQKREISKSTIYNRMDACPNTFEDYLTKARKAATPKLNPIKYYEMEYEHLRNSTQPTDVNQ